MEETLMDEWGCNTNTEKEVLVLEVVHEHQMRIRIQ
jgi:hypothetical protein